MRGAFRDHRRRRLVAATITAIHRYGFADATVARIAALAGVSAGNIHHYFGGKDGLLEEAMRALHGEVRALTAERLAAATDPDEQLRIIVESNFAPEIFSAEACTAWLHFLAQATHVEQLARLARVNTRRLRSNLVAALRQLVDAGNARDIADAAIAMIDGLWLHRAQGVDLAPPGRASGIVLDYIRTRLAAARKASARARAAS